MDDIFYLCPEKIKLEDIKAAFQKVKKVDMDEFFSSDTIQIKYKDKRMNFVLMDFNEFEDKLDSKMIVEKNICSIVCISHHKTYSKEVLELVEILLIRWGGYLGNDREGFLPIYNLSNIEYFTYK